MIAALLFLILFAILFRGAFRFLLFLMFIGGIVLLGEAHADDATCNPHSIISDGFFTHGSMVCNPNWLDRPASVAMVTLASRCGNLSENSIISLGTQGAKDFDISVIHLGHKGACAKLDKEMTSIDNAR